MLFNKRLYAVGGLKTDAGGSVAPFNRLPS
jgi:hypothetical protein